MTSVAAGVNNTVVINGSEDSTIVISDINTGKMVSIFGFNYEIIL